MKWIVPLCLVVCVAGFATAQVRNVPREEPAPTYPGGPGATTPGGSLPGTSYQGGAPDLRGTFGNVPGAPPVRNPDGSIMEPTPSTAPSPGSDSAVDAAQNPEANLQVAPPSVPEEPEDGDGESEEAGDGGDWWQGWLALLLIGAFIVLISRDKR